VPSACFCSARDAYNREYVPLQEHFLPHRILAIGKERLDGGMAQNRHGGTMFVVNLVEKPAFLHIEIADLHDAGSVTFQNHILRAQIAAAHLA
jgi:hypothetical protein